jgi:hypothetical protein
MFNHANFIKKPLAQRKKKNKRQIEFLSQQKHFQITVSGNKVVSLPLPENSTKHL